MVMKNRRQSLVILSLLLVLLGLLVIPAIVQADNNPPDSVLLYRQAGGYLVHRLTPHRRQCGGAQASEP